MDPKPELLMLSRRFAPLFWTQFFSAFNDNFLKNSLAFLILYQLGGQDSGALITLAGAVFIAPYFFLSAIGGQVADRYDKALIAQRLKFVEIGVAVIAIAGFALHSIVILFIALFGFGVIGSLFGPIKYGILPDHLEAQRIAERQCAGRRRDLCRDPAGHDRRRHRGERRRPSGDFLRTGPGLRDFVLALQLAHSTHRRRRAASRCVEKYRRVDVGADPAFA